MIAWIFLMGDGLKTVAVIPARGGSKRLPGKNLINLGGKPLIAWTIEAAIEAKVFEVIVVSSDDEKILSVASKYPNIVTSERPEYLASDTATTVDTVAHVVSELEEKGTWPDAIAILQPTSPLRSAGDITAAFELFVQKKSTVVSVCELEHPIEWSGTLENGYLTGLNDSLLRSQDHKKRYRLNGAIYICQRLDISIGTPLIKKGPLAYVMPAGRSVDIDTLFDLELCEFILGGQ